MARLLDLIRQQGQPNRLAVIYSTELQAAHELRRDLSDLIPEEDIIVSRFSPTLGAYVGPNALGVAISLPVDSPG